jgi:hypothetical protein
VVRTVADKLRLLALALILSAPMGVAVAANSVDVDINVTIDNRSITSLSSDLNPSTSGQNVTFTAIVRAVLGAAVPNPTGTVTFSIDAVAQPPSTLGVNNIATFSTAGLSAGYHLITAHYNGDAEIQPSDSPAFTQTVKSPSNATLVSSSPGVPAQVGTSVTFTATVATGATGNVTFYIDGIPQSPAVPLSGLASNQAALSTSTLSLGVHSIMASYPGDPNFAPSNSNIVVQDIQATPTVTLTASANPATIGQSVTYTASVSSILGNPSGWVVFTDTTTVPITQSAQIPLVGGNASTTFTLAAPAGSHAITAAYSGDANFAAVTANLTETANLATILTLTALPVSSTYGQNVAITASLSPNPGTTTTVTFSDGTTVLGTAALSGGSATLNLATLSVGTHALTASYPGDAGFGSSTGALSFTVSRATPVVTLASSANPSALGQSVTFTAIVNSVVGNPSGTVTFVDTTTAATLGTATLTGGVATVSHTFAIAASDDIVATYNGDTNFASAASNTVTQNVANNPPVFTSSPVLTGTQGASYVYNVTTSDPDAGATLTVSATTLPTWLLLTPGANGTATLTGTPANGDVGANTVTLKVSDGTLTATQTFTITVADVNDAPTFTSAPVLIGAQGAAYSYSIVATDIDAPAQPLTITAPTLPGWLTFTSTGNGTATLTGTPANANVGANTVLLAVTDGIATTFQPFTITVADSNDAPTFTSSPVLATSQGAVYLYSITASDIDVPPQTLTFSAAVLPSWLTLTPGGTNGTATLSGISSNANVGTNLVSLQVSDGIATTTQSFTITVANVNDAPTFTSAPVLAGTQGASYSYSIVTNDIDVPAQTLTITAPTLPGWLTLTSTGNGTATLTGTPANANAGANTVLLAVTDGIATTFQAFTITVANSNDAPVFTSSPVLTGTQGGAYVYTITASDIDLPAQALTFSAPVLPTWLTLTPGGANGTATLSGISSNANVGANLVSLQVSDGIATTTQNFTITIANVNDAPTFTTAPVLAGAQGTAYSYSIVTTDIDVPAQPLTITAPTLPGWLTLTATGNGTATLTGTPSNANVGANTVLLAVTDGIATTFQAFTITVADTNDAPVFTSSPVLTTSQGAVYSYSITASDIDLPPQTLTFSGAVLPSWLTLTPGGTNGTATLSGVSSNANVGANLVSLQVSDGIGTTTQNFTITVVNVNDAPTFTSAPILSGTQGAAYSYSIVTSDIDLPTQVLTITAPTLPSWLTLTPTGNGTATLTGTPSNANVGTNGVLLAVTDGIATTFQNFVITVSNVNDPPVFTSSPVLTTSEGAVYSYSITTSDSDLPSQTLTISASLLPSWLTLTPGATNGTATLSGVSSNANVGANLVSLQVSDGIATTTQNFTITVTNVNDAPTFTSAPVLSGTQGAAYTYSIVTNDIDLPAQPLTISAPLLPSWLTLTPSATNGSATLSGTPGNANVGSNNVILVVTDGLAMTLQSFSIVVADVNDPPVFTSAPSLNGTPGSLYMYAITANDIDVPAQTLSFSATVLPAWLTLTPGGANGTASLSGTPTTANLGANGVTLQVSDGTSTVTQSFTITISSPNTPPVFASAPVTTGAQASAYTYNVVAADIDVPQQTLALSAPILPAWLTLTAGATNGTATLAGTPGIADVGSNTVILSVSDGLATTLQSFTITVSGANAAPAITTLDPAAALVSGGGFDLIINGTNFVPASVVNWKGLPRPTIYVNANLLIAIIPAADLNTVGMIPVTVFNPAPGGGTSAAALFPVENPAPVVTDLNPASALAGDPNFTMTISGVNFVAGSTVNFGSTALTTTFVNSTQLTATVPGSAIATSGTVAVTVVNAGPGGGSSNDKMFVIKPGKPVVTSPASATPNPAVVSQNVTFSVSGIAGDGNPLNVAWDFGDGTNGVGPSLIHQFTAPNTYTVTATLTDSLGTSVTSKVTVVVTAAAAPPPTTQPLTITKKSIKAKNPSLGKDITTLTGSLTLPAGSTQPLLGTVIVNVGAVQQTFTLAKGIGKTGTSLFKFNKSKTLPTVTFGAKITGNFIAVLQTAGLAPGASAPVTIPVSIIFGGNTYAVNVPFTVKGTSKGSTGK